MSHHPRRRSTDHIDSGWSKRKLKVIGICCVIALFSITLRIATTSSITNQIQDERKAACKASKKRNRDARLFVNTQLPSGHQRQLTYRFIDIISPRNCDKFIKAGE